MKIYFNGRFFSQRITGVQRYAFEMLKALDEVIDSGVASTDEYVLLLPPHTECNTALKRIKVRQIGHLKGHLWEQLELPFYTRDGFLVNFCNCAPILKKNQTVTIHDVAVLAYPSGFSFLFRLWYRIMFSCLSMRLRLFFTVSEFSKKELNSYLGIPFDHIHVTYNGAEHIKKSVSDGVFQQFGVAAGRYILAVGSVNPNKNFDLVLKVAERIPEYNFIIAGGGNSTVFRQKKMYVPDNVKFLGYVTDEELFALYAHAGCFLFPSLYEGFGIPPLEAMVCGCPVVASNSASIPEICGNAAIYCDPCLQDDWVDAIRIVLGEDHEVHDSLVKNSLAVTSRYTWTASARKMMRMILS